VACRKIAGGGASSRKRGGNERILKGCGNGVGIVGSRIAGRALLGRREVEMRAGGAAVVIVVWNEKAVGRGGCLSGRGGGGPTSGR